MKKRLISAVCALSMLFTACSSSKTDETPQGNSVEGEITLTIGHNKDFVSIPESIIKAGERLNEKYKAEGKNIQVSFKQENQNIDWNEYHNKIVFAHKSKQSPDIYTLSPYVSDLVDTNSLLNIDDIKSDSIVDTLWEPFKYNGSYYGVPFDMPLRVMYYNKQALSTMGWSEEEIAQFPEKVKNGEITLEDFTKLAEESVKSGATEVGLMHRPGEGGDFEDIHNALGGEYYTEDGKLVFDEKGLVNTYEYFYNNANKSKITPQNLNNMGWPTINKTIGTGKVFAYFGPLFASTYMAQEAGITVEEFGKTMGFALFPTSKNSDTPFTVAAPQGVGISSQTKYPEICKDLMKELTNESADLLTEHAVGISALPSVKSELESDAVKENAILSDLSSISDYAKIVPTINDYGFYRSEFFKYLVEIELGTLKPKEAVAKFKEQVKLNVDAENIVFK